MSNVINSFSFNTCAGIRFGYNILNDLAQEVRSKLGPRIILISDPGLTRLGLYQPFKKKLVNCGAEVLIFDGVSEDPTREVLLAAVDQGRGFLATGVLGFGGGSSLDIAKLTSLLVGSAEDLDQAWGVANAKGPRLPLVLIPTTSGTGSEVTPVSIITVDETEKRGVSSSILIPDLAILDPALTMNLPQNVTAATGVDAMVHAIEAYTSKSMNNNPMSGLLAIESLRLIGGSIEDAVSDGSNNKVARGNMLLGSMFAGMAFANSPVAAVHALAYPIGGTFHVSHGLSNAVILPHVMEFNSFNSSVMADYAFLGPFIFPELADIEDDVKVCQKFIKNLTDLSKKLGLPAELRELKIPKDACKTMAVDALKQSRLLVNNPREVTEEDARTIYEKAW